MYTLSPTEQVIISSRPRAAQPTGQGAVAGQQQQELPISEGALLLCTECCFLKTCRDLSLQDTGLSQEGCEAGEWTEASLLCQSAEIT